MFTINMDNKQIKVNNSTYNVIRKYLSEDEAVLLSNKIVSLSNNKVTITNTGVVSSGKSSLFNVLLDKENDERFPVGAARTTVLKDVEKYNDMVLFVDTPGIDVKTEDDKIALNAVCASSIIMMVHNIKIGMLHKNEIDWLNKIAVNYGSKQEFADRFIFVNSWIDERMNESSYNDTLKMISDMIYQNVGVNVEIYNVSAKLYKQGVKKNQDVFINMSGIPSLKEAIERKSKLFIEKYGYQTNKYKVSNLCYKNETKLQLIKNNKKNDYENESSRVKNKYLPQKEEWGIMYSRFKNITNQIKKIDKKIEECEVN